jgi:hypothetical protein
MVGQNSSLPAIAQVTISVAVTRENNAAWIANLRQRPGRTLNVPKSGALRPNGIASPYQTQIGQDVPPPVITQSAVTAKATTQPRAVHAPLLARRPARRWMTGCAPND